MFGITAIDHSDMRARNLAVILNSLREHAPISRSGLAKATGLNKATVTSLVRELSSASFVRELDIIPSESLGRPAVGLGLNPEAGCILSLEIAVDYISIILTDFTAEVFWRLREHVPDPPELDATLKRTMQIIEEAYSQTSRCPGPVFGIACGVPGLVDRKTGTLLFAPNLGWADVPLRAMIASALNIPVIIDNEANMAALGEAFYGAARDFDQVLYVSSGVGLGGGIVINGQVLSGAAGFAGEIGHMTVEPEGLPCKCGNRGCWEVYASQRAVFRRVREEILAGRKAPILEATKGDLAEMTIPLIVEAFEKGDDVSREALEDVGRWMGIGIASLINALNPQRVVVGGILSLAHELVIPIIEDVVRERAWSWSHEVCEIVAAQYGADACVMGGIAAIHRDILGQLGRWTAT